MRSIFHKTEAEGYTLIDGDVSYPAGGARKMYSMELNGKADMVIGAHLSSSYFQENKHPFHNVDHALVYLLNNLLFHSNIHDIMTGYRMSSPFFVKNYPILSKGFEIETEMSISPLDKNILLQEFPINYRGWTQGSVSKLDTFKRVLATIIFLFRGYKSFWRFPLTNLLFLACSISIFIPILIEYSRTGVIHGFPILIISGVAAICYLLFLSSSLHIGYLSKKHITI